MLVSNRPQTGRPACPTQRAPEGQITTMLYSLMASMDETNKRLTRMETRMVNLMAVHNLDRDGLPLKGTV